MNIVEWYPYIAGATTATMGAVAVDYFRRGDRKDGIYFAALTALCGVIGTGFYFKMNQPYQSAPKPSITAAPPSQPMPAYRSYSVDQAKGR